MKKTTMLRQLLARDGILVVPGAYNAISAVVAYKAGFDAVYMTGSGAATSLTGYPDNGLVTETEMVMNARYMADAIPVPLISDADTGYGNAVNVIRTIRDFERAGVAAIHLEDQVTPKRCGHVAGKDVVTMEEAVGKIRAAVEAREDPDFVIIARCDSRAVHGFDDAVRRGRAYLEAGADVVFPEALESREEFAEYAKAVRAPLLANMTEYGKTPYMTHLEFQEMGYKIVIYPATSFRVTMKALEDFYAHLKRTGTQGDYLDQMVTRARAAEITEYDRYHDYEKRFVG
jgi:methylisocitrate lyase